MPTNRRSLRPSGVRTRARSSGPYSPGSSSAATPSLNSDFLMSARSPALWCRPPLPRPREKITVPPFLVTRQARCSSGQPGVAAGGAVAAGTPHRVGQLVDALEVCPFDALHDKLRDPVTPGDLGRV